MRIDLSLRGTAPLLIQSDQLVDPLNDLTKAIKALTGKRKKTDDDHREIARLEWYGSLYYDPETGPYVPGDNLQACLRAGGTFSRQGTAVERAVVVLTDRMAIEYQGPRDIDALWGHGRQNGVGAFEFRRSVVVQRARTMRSRPIFRKWSLSAQVELATDLLNLNDFTRIAEDAGRLSGLGTWRPRYGRFEVTVG